MWLFGQRKAMEDSLVILESGEKDTSSLYGVIDGH
jgi:serine/threonine protein phosphatase PrpC